MSFLGWPATTGADFMDYMVVDEIASSPVNISQRLCLIFWFMCLEQAWEEQRSERLVYLPHTMFLSNHKVQYRGPTG